MVQRKPITEDKWSASFVEPNGQFTLLPLQWNRSTNPPGAPWVTPVMCPGFLPSQQTGREKPQHIPHLDTMSSNVTTNFPPDSFTQAGIVLKISHPHTQHLKHNVFTCICKDVLTCRAGCKENKVTHTANKKHQGTRLATILCVPAEAATSNTV